MKVAIVHDWLNQIGGAENVLEEMVNIFPNADIFTSIYAPEKMPPLYTQWPIQTSFMQKLPGIKNRHQPYMPIYPIAFQKFNLSGYDLVLSNKSGFCHGVGINDNPDGNSNGTSKVVHTSNHPKSTTSNGRGPVHVCYCLTPTRFLWSFEQYQARENIGNAANLLLTPLLPALRKWDKNAASNVHHFIAISSEIQHRIREIYNRESTIIYPPVDTAYFTPPQSTAGEGSELSVKTPKKIGNPASASPTAKIRPNESSEIKQSQDDQIDCPDQPNKSSGTIYPQLPQGIKSGQYFLIVSRLIPYKRIDLAVEAFANLPEETLVIVGDGRDRDALKSMATDNVHFLGRLERIQIRELLRYCKAFIFSGLEDFGIAPVEAMSTGRPVVAFAGGGALDTVAPGVSGELFKEQTADSLLSVLQNFDADAYSPEACRLQAEKFSTHNFRTQLYKYIESVMG